MIQSVDFVIIGSGVAGLRASIELAPEGNVLILTKSRADESNTEYAQGGIAVAMSDEDRIGLHYQDTLRAGDGLCNEQAVGILVEEGPARIRELIGWGTQFDREGSKLAFTREAAHSRRRVLHAHGDATGREINRTLLRKVRSLLNVSILPYTYGLRLLVGPNGCEGVSYLDKNTGAITEVRARAVLLASGGLGAVFRETTNPDIATGDGCSLAFHAGAVLADMEFVQFHPTALKLENTPRFLLSEAMRGEGGRLRNAAGEAFMENYDPMAELAPRDVVARAIFCEAKRTGQDVCYLDMTHLSRDFLETRFPKIFSTCLAFGLDLSARPAPVFPAAHYTMGGVSTDVHCHTTLPGLFAAGEVACTGVHGANRLASNSLLEGLVYGARAGRGMAHDWAGSCKMASFAVSNEPWPVLEATTAPPEDRIRQLMTEQVGILRNARGLTQAREELSALPFGTAAEIRVGEINSKLTNARLISGSALLRTESRGAHFREDYPARDDADWKKRVTACYDLANKRVVFGTIDVAGTKDNAR